MKKNTLITIGIILVLVLAFFAISYNSLIKLDEGVNQAYSQVDNVIQRRADLIPNLVNTVKGYTKHESETLQKVVEARSDVKDAKNLPELAEANTELTKSINVMVEAYPELKANTVYTQLMDELAGAENRISVERKNYNRTVQDFNTKVKRFPTNIIANILGFSEKTYFEADPSAKTVPQVDLISE